MNRKIKRNEWRPVSKLHLKHKIQGRNVFVAKFKAIQRYEYKDVSYFVEKMHNNLKNTVVKTIQISFELNNNQFYSSKVTNIDEELILQDFRNLYLGNNILLGFSIFLT